MTITDKDLRTLRVAMKAAGKHGDVFLCDQAMRGNVNARRMCAELFAPLAALAAVIP